MQHTAFRVGVKDAIPICLGIIPTGISYGLLAVQAGLSKLQTVLMSALVMAGSSQLMAIGMIGNATVPSIVAAVFFVNLRHIVMSCSVVDKLEKTPLSKRLLCISALCDESFALFSIANSHNAAYLLGTNTVLYCTWVLISFVGCVMGQLLPQFVSKSFGIAFYAAFLAMLIPHTAKNRGLLYLVLLSAGLNTALQLLLPTSLCVILSMVICAVAGTYFVEVNCNE